MTKDAMTQSEQTKSFNESVDLFFGMNPKSCNWILLLLYFCKERLVNVVENYSGNSDNIFLRLDIDDISDDKVVAQWNNANIRNKCIIVDNQHNSFQQVRDLIEEINNDIFYNRRGDNPGNIFLIDRWEPTFLFQIAERFISISDEWYAESATWAFDVIVRRIQNHLGMHGGFFVQPQEITELAVGLLDATSGSVYDPYAGLCSYAVKLDEKCEYYGDEFFTPAYVAGKLNLLISGKNNAKLGRRSVTENWTVAEKQCFDYIISTPPFGLRLNNSANHINTTDLDFLARASHCANKKSVGVYPASMCLNVSQANSRVYRDLVDSDTIEMVILLPHNTLPHTLIATAIIVTNKEKKRKGSIRFVDASEMYIASGRNNSICFVDNFVDIILSNSIDGIGWVKDVSLEDVAANKYNLYPKTYLCAHINDIPTGYHKVNLAEVVEICRGTRNFEDASGSLAKISTLATIPCDCERKVEDFEVTESLNNAIKVEEPVILIAKSGNAKPTYCKASKSNPLFVHPNVMAFRVTKDWVCPHYLCYELSRRIIKVGEGVLPYYSRERILLTALGFPSRNFEEQYNIVNEARFQYKFERANELGLQEVIEKMKFEYISEIRNRKHDMRPHLRNLRSTERLIRHYLTTSDNVADMVDKIGGLLDKWKVSLEHLSDLIDIFSDEDHFGTPELIDLNKYFRELVTQYNIESHGFNMKYNCDTSAFEELGIVHRDSKRKEFSLLNGIISLKYEVSSEDISLYTHIARVDLDRVVTNIVSNAQKYGFTNNQRNDYIITINLSVDPKRNMYQIDFINNGTPLPAGMDKVRYGMRGVTAGVTTGTGKGGYIVKSVVEHYKGDFDVFMDDMGTVIRVWLPISENNNE